MRPGEGLLRKVYLKDGKLIDAMLYAWTSDE
jgi:hypothetical protein